MTKYVIQQSIFTAADGVDIAPFAQVTITNASDDSAAELWEDADGTEPISGNVVNADENGFFRVYVDQGEYNLSILANDITTELLNFQVVSADAVTAAQTSAETAADDATSAAAAAQAAAAKISVELVTRADSGDGARREVLRYQAGSTSSDAIITNPTYNRIRTGSASAGIMSGGSAVDPHLIGYGYNRYAFDALSSILVIPYEVADTSKLLVRKHTATNIQANLSVGTGASQYAVSVGGGSTTITLVVGLAANERCYVEDQGVVEDKGGTMPSYSGIGPGGYDCHVWKNVMNHLRGAHHRIFDGDHNTIMGGSYCLIWDGSYGFIGGSTQSEVGPGASNGAGVVGGIRSRARGQGAGAVFSAESDIAAAWAIGVGGYRIKITATASAACGRSITISGSDSWGWGRENTSTGNYNNIGGYQCVAYGSNTVISGTQCTSFGNFTNVLGNLCTSRGDYTSVRGNQCSISDDAHHHSRIMGGYRGSTQWPAEIIDFVYRDTENSGQPYIKLTEVHLRKVTAGTVAEKLATIDGETDTFTPTSGQIWLCTLHVVARTGALKGGAWKIEYCCQNVSGTVSINGSPTVTAIGQDAQLGSGGNAATISVSSTGSAIELYVQPRLDLAITTKWYGSLTIREVN